MNLYDLAAPGAGAETLMNLLEHGGIRIETIRSNRAQTGWYDQEEDEWVVLLEGSAELLFEDRSVALRAGECLLIPAHVRHRVAETSADARWLAIFISTQGR